MSVEICKEMLFKGTCSRGAACKFSHITDSVSRDEIRRGRKQRRPNQTKHLDNDPLREAREINIDEMFSSVNRSSSGGNASGQRLPSDRMDQPKNGENRPAPKLVPKQVTVVNHTSSKQRQTNDRKPVIQGSAPTQTSPKGVNSPVTTDAKPNAVPILKPKNYKSVQDQRDARPQQGSRPIRNARAYKDTRNVRNRRPPPDMHDTKEPKGPAEPPKPRDPRKLEVKPRERKEQQSVKSPEAVNEPQEPKEVKKPQPAEELKEEEVSKPEAVPVPQVEKVQEPVQGQQVEKVQEPEAAVAPLVGKEPEAKESARPAPLPEPREGVNPAMPIPDVPPPRPLPIDPTLIPPQRPMPMSQPPFTPPQPLPMGQPPFPRRQPLPMRPAPLPAPHPLSMDPTGGRPPQPMPINPAPAPLAASAPIPSQSEQPSNLQVVPLLPSITVRPTFTFPGAEIDITLLLADNSVSAGDWLGLFRSHQHQSTRVIAQRQLSRLRCNRTSSNGKRFRKFVCQFYAPKHAGRYAFRYFKESDFVSTLDSNEVIVAVRGRDLDEAIDFVGDQASDMSTLAFNISSLTTTFQYLIDLDGWKSPKKLEKVLHAMIEPFSFEHVPKEYTQQTMNNLHFFVGMLMQYPGLMDRLSVETRKELHHLMSHYCNICSLFIVQDDQMEKHMRGQHLIPVINEYVPFKQMFLNELTRQVVAKSRELLPTQAFYETREALIERLTEGFHKHERFAKSMIFIYGSSNNGFGTDDSDIDLCLVDESIKISEIETLAESVASILEEMKLEEIDKSRLKARIPVIRFCDPISNLQCDLCFNNILPIRNTILLKTYSYIDPRVRILGLIIKKWAKSNYINNPAYKTLSSYGYILMLIHFLQSAIQPPILPILQELPPSWDGMHLDPNTRLPQVPVQNYQGSVYDTYFYQPRSVEFLREFAKRNTMTVGELLVKFFYYYAFQFDNIHSVVTIRKRGALNREEKCYSCMWKPAMQLCVEDPFETDYDVAHVITPHSSQIILQCFAKTYAVLLEKQEEDTDWSQIDLLNEIFQLMQF